VRQAEEGFRPERGVYAQCIYMSRAIYSVMWYTIVVCNAIRR